MSRYKHNYYKSIGADLGELLPCFNCGKVARNLHHIVYRSHCGSDDPSNLIPLCSTCHNSHHNNNTPTTEEIKALKMNEDNFLNSFNL